MGALLVACSSGVRRGQTREQLGPGSWALCYRMYVCVSVLVVLQELLVVKCPKLCLKGELDVDMVLSKANRQC